MGAIALVGILGAIFGICVARRRRRAALRHSPSSSSYPMGSAPNAGGVGGVGGGGGVFSSTTAAVGGAGFAAVGQQRGMRSSDSSAFVLLQQDNSSYAAWNASSYSVHSPYLDHTPNSPGGMNSGVGRGMQSGEFEADPYYQHTPVVGYREDESGRGQYSQQQQQKFYGQR